MARELNAVQQNLLDLIKTQGSVKKGEGYSLSTARVLAREALIALEERKDASGKVYFWRARSTRPVAPAPQGETVASSQVRPAGAFVIRVAVRNPGTDAVTFTQVRHVPDAEELDRELVSLGVELRAGVRGSGGSFTLERRKVVWREMASDGAVWEFVCGGEVYRVRPAKLGGWEALHVDSDEVVAAGNDPAEVEGRARSDAADFNRALRS